MKRIYTIMVLVALCLSVIFVPAYATENATSGIAGDSTTWMCQDDVLIIAGSGNMYGYENYGMPWKDCEFTSVVIEEGVTSIGSRAFAGLNVPITIANGVTTIGSYAFENASLAEIVLPDGLETIETCAFMGCSKLQRIVFPKNVSDFGLYAFMDCTNLTEITFTGDAPSIGPAFIGVTATAYYPANNETWTEKVNLDYGGSIEWVAYEEEEDITYVPMELDTSYFVALDEAHDGVYYKFTPEKFGYYMLSTSAEPMKVYCFTTDSDDNSIPSSNSYKGDPMHHPPAIFELNGGETYYFALGSSQVSFTFELREVAGMPAGENVIWTCRDGILKFSGTGDMYNYDVYQKPWQYSKYSSVVIEEGITSIGDHTWLGPDITIADSVTSIGNYAFEMSSMTEINLPDALNYIGASAFSNSKLQKIVIPSGVSEIGMLAFSTCYDLTEITFTGDAPLLRYPFSGVTATVYYPRENETWTEDVMQQYGGTLTWVPYCVEHNYVSNVTDPTCIAKGYTTHTCVCGDTYIDMYVDALGHNMDAWKSTKAATCTEAGTERRDCTRCDHYEIQEAKAAGHSYTAVVTEPTCTEKGYTTHICSVCKDSYMDSYTDKTDHKYESIGITAPGEQTEKCQCGKTRVTEIYGWSLFEGKWYYREESGEIVTDAWRKDSKGWCYLGGDGAMLTNCWATDSKGWCYIGPDGYCETNCWKADSIGWLYLDSEGSMTKNQWVYTDGYWYYLDAEGYMATDCWRRDSYGWCYLGSNGAMLTNCWAIDSKGWCYIGANGYCETECWKQDSYGWLYLDSEGSMTKSQWLEDGGAWYYLDDEGYMVTGEQEIDGTWYVFNDSGIWVG